MWEERRLGVGNSYCRVVEVEERHSLAAEKVHHSLVVEMVHHIVLVVERHKAAEEAHHSLVVEMVHHIVLVVERHKAAEEAHHMVVVGIDLEEPHHNGVEGDRLE